MCCLLTSCVRSLQYFPILVDQIYQDGLILVLFKLVHVTKVKRPCATLYMSVTSIPMALAQIPSNLSMDLKPCFTYQVLQHGTLSLSDVIVRP